MNKIIISSVLAIFLFSSIVSAALGIGFPKEVNQEKNTEMEHTLTAFTFGEKNNKAMLTVKEGQNCISFPNGNYVEFGDKDIAYIKMLTSTKKGCDNSQVKIQLSPVESISSKGTVGMNLAVAKSFFIKSVKPTVSTFAIIAITALILAVLILVSVMVKIAKRKS